MPNSVSSLSFLNQVTPAPTNKGCCEGFYNASATKANSMWKGAKNLTASASEWLKRTWAAVVGFFLQVVHTFKNLDIRMKAFAVVTLGASVLLAVLFTRCCCPGAKKEEATEKDKETKNDKKAEEETKPDETKPAKADETAKSSKKEEPKKNSKKEKEEETSSSSKT